MNKKDPHTPFRSTYLANRKAWMILSFLIFSFYGKSEENIDSKLQIKEDTYKRCEKLDSTFIVKESDSSLMKKVKVYVNIGTTLITSDGFQSIEIVIIDSKSESTESIARSTTESKNTQPKVSIEHTDTIEKIKNPIVILSPFPADKSIGIGSFLELNLIPVNPTYLAAGNTNDKANTNFVFAKNSIKTYEVNLDSIHFLNSLWTRPPPFYSNV